MGLLEAVSVAEEDLLDGLFAVSLETSLLSSDNDNNYNVNDAATLQTSSLSSEEKATTIPSAGKSDDVIERVTEMPSPAEDSTTDSSAQLDNSSSRKVSILLVEDINNEAAEDNSCTLDTDEDEDMAEAEEALCENCSCIACKDGEVGCSP